MAFHTHPENVSARLDKAGESRLLVREIPAIGQDVWQRERRVHIFIVGIDLGDRARKQDGLEPFDVLLAPLVSCLHLELQLSECMLPCTQRDRAT